MQKQNNSDKTSLFDLLRSVAEGSEFSSLLSSLLVDMCKIDTVPTEDKKRNADSEAAVYQIIRQAIQEHALDGTFIEHRIKDAIKAHPAYTKPYYQNDEDYEGRYNLVHIVHAGLDTGGVALNAHIDTVKPYFPPVMKEGAIIGRGTSDDKGCCVSIIGALILLKNLYEKTGISLKKPVVSMFVTDEESGGNGSLSVALDRSLAAIYDTILVVESTEGKLHPANRGAIWYKLTLDGLPKEQLQFAFKAVRALDECGALLRSESEHPMFATRPVQTCHGILGSYGEHPARTCSKVVLRIDNPPQQIQHYISEGLANYIDKYTDRTLVIDADSGKAKIERHIDIDFDQTRCLLTVWGTAGHMGKALENDSAIVKAAWIAEQLYAHVDASQISLAESSTGPLVLEGGQGFLPTHTIEQVKQRMSQAIDRLYLAHQTSYSSLKKPNLSFDKLHNDAFARNADSREMEMALYVGHLMNVADLEPVIGWPVSCDARIFAGEYPEKQVITVGPGTIAYAHTDNEQITVKELVDGALQLALNVLVMTGTCVPDEIA